MSVLPVVEPLEKRELMSITLVGRQLNVVGAGRSANTITVGLNPGGASLFAEISYPLKKGTFNQTKSFPLSRVGLVNIGGGNASDLITIDQTNGSFPVLTHITTHNGVDTVMGGDEPDRIICGNGIDVVNSGNGNDTLQAGRGPDTLVGGDGNDHFQSGQSHDVLVGGNGNNTFVDPFGHTVIHGGSGHNTFILKSIQLDPDTTYTPGKDILQHYTPPSKSSNVWNDILNGLIDYGGFL
jgi:Ca2+-binding RTX toxin-like protein